MENKFVTLVYGETDSTGERRFILTASEAFQKVREDFADEMSDWRGEESLTVGQELRFDGVSPHTMRTRYIWVESASDFEAFRDEMWYDADVVSWARQCMNDYDPEIHGTRVAAEIAFKEEEIKARWKERVSLS